MATMPSESSTRNQQLQRPHQQHQGFQQFITVENKLDLCLQTI